MTVQRTVKRTGSWAADLVHPVPLAAVGLLALNDHLLKGAGLVPAAITGKLSDFAGLFFFPLLLAGLARGASAALRGRDIEDRRSLAAVAAIATAAGFAAVKLLPAVNALVARTWGVMVMDPTDLIALPMVGLAAAWMLRDARPVPAGRSDRRRALDFAAVLAASIASIATSQAKPPPTPPSPPPPQAVAMAVAEDPSCAELAIETCERTATQTLVVVRARSKNGGTCTIDVLRAEEAALGGGHTAADVLPKNVAVQGDQSRTFALTFLRPVGLDERSGRLLARAQMRAVSASGVESVDEVELSGGCSGH
jgi:hypothetical protein